MVSARPENIRGTQTFVGTLASTWSRPTLTLLEVAWRWSFGAPALLLIMVKVHGVLLAVTHGTLRASSLGLDAVLLNDPIGTLSADPLGATAKWMHAFGLIEPGLRHLAAWLLPMLVVGWIVQSSVGRTLVLRRADARLHVRIGTLIVLQTLRLGVLAGVIWVWLRLVGWSAGVAILAPISQHAEPSLVLYCALLIVFSLGLFTAWALTGWVLQAAPLLAMLRDLGPLQSLKATLGLGRLTGKLAEVNLVLGIVKIALIVLAMVFSATPLPFESVTTREFLAWWWAGVALIYLVWCNFFHVAQLLGFLHLCRLDGDSEG